jgi:hypothetical protein
MVNCVEVAQGAQSSSFVLVTISTPEYSRSGILSLRLWYIKLLQVAQADGAVPTFSLPYISGPMILTGQLIAEAILRETTGRQRNRVYAAQRIIEIVEIEEA